MCGVVVFCVIASGLSQAKSINGLNDLWVESDSRIRPEEDFYNEFFADADLRSEVIIAVSGQWVFVGQCLFLSRWTVYTLSCTQHGRNIEVWCSTLSLRRVSCTRLLCRRRFVDRSRGDYCGKWPTGICVTMCVFVALGQPYSGRERTSKSETVR